MRADGSSSGIEQRRHPRHSRLLKVEYADSAEFLSGWTENISEGGFFVRTDQELVIGQQMHLTLSFPGLLEKLEVEGTVRWIRAAEHDQPRGVGVQVDSEKARRTLARIALQTSDVMANREQAGTFRVLVVEDNEYVIKACDSVLRHLDNLAKDIICVDFAADGHEALAKAHAELPDLVITDLYMPVMDGFALIERLRDLESTASVPIAVVTGGGVDVRSRVEALGIDAFLEKPIRFGELMETIVYLIHLRDFVEPE